MSTKKPAYSKILDGSTEVSAKTFNIWYQDPSDIVGGSLLRKVCGSIALYPSNLTACVSVGLFKLIKLPKRNFCNVLDTLWTLKSVVAPD